MARPQQSRSRSPRGQAALDSAESSDFELTSSRTTRVLTVASSGPMARTTASFFPSGVIRPPSAMSMSPPQVSIEQIPERAVRADPMNRRLALAQVVGVSFTFLLGWNAPEGKVQAPQPEHFCRDCGETIPAIFSRLPIHPCLCNQCAHEKRVAEMENFDAMVHDGLDDEEVNEDGWHDLNEELFGDHFEAPDIGADSWDEFSTAEPSTSDCSSCSCGCESSTPSEVDDDTANLRDVRSDIDIAAEIEITLLVTAGEYCL